MSRRYLLHRVFLSTLWVLILPGPIFGQDPPRGPLRVCEANPRYFTDGSGRAIYLTGSHTWNNLQDMGPTDPNRLVNLLASLCITRVLSRWRSAKAQSNTKV